MSVNAYNITNATESITAPSLIAFDLTSFPSFPITFKLTGSQGYLVTIVIGWDGNYQHITVTNGHYGTTAYLTLPTAIPAGTGIWKNYLTIFVATSTSTTSLYDCIAGVYFCAGPMTVFPLVSTWPNTAFVTLDPVTYTMTCSNPINYYVLSIPYANCLGLVLSYGTNSQNCSTVNLTMCSNYGTTSNLPFCSQQTPGPSFVGNYIDNASTRALPPLLTNGTYTWTTVNKCQAAAKNANAPYFAMQNGTGSSSPNTAACFYGTNYAEYGKSTATVPFDNYGNYLGGYSINSVYNTSMPLSSPVSIPITTSIPVSNPTTIIPITTPISVPITTPIPVSNPTTIVPVSTGSSSTTSSNPTVFPVTSTTSSSSSQTTSSSQPVTTTSSSSSTPVTSNVPVTSSLPVITSTSPITTSSPTITSSGLSLNMEILIFIVILIIISMIVYVLYKQKSGPVSKSSMRV